MKKLFFATVKHSDPGDTGSAGDTSGTPDAGTDAGNDGAGNQGNDGLGSDDNPCDGLVFD